MNGLAANLDAYTGELTEAQAVALYLVKELQGVRVKAGAVSVVRGFIKDVAKNLTVSPGMRYPAASPLLQLLK